MNKYAAVALFILIAVSGCASTGQTIQNKEAENRLNFSATNITIHAISVSSNALFIDTAGTDVLYDAGDRKDSTTVINYISKFDIKNLTLVPSHHHTDHIGGMTGVLDEMNVTNVLDSGSQYTTKTFAAFIEKAKTKDFIVVKRGNRFILDNDVTIEILNPGPADANLPHYFNDENDNSIVMKLTYGEFSMLFTGDCEKACEDDMLESNVDLDADVLSVGHHGSRTSTSDAFLASVSPEAATIGVASGNQYGHPHEETIDKLNKRNIQIYRTDIDGNIIINTNGKSFDIAKEI